MSYEENKERIRKGAEEYKKMKKSIYEGWREEQIRNLEHVFVMFGLAQALNDGIEDMKENDS